MHSTKRKTNEQFVNELKEKMPHVEPLEDYTNNRTKIKCKCLKHNNIFETTPKKLLLGINTCKDCIIENKIKSHTRTNEEFLQELQENNIDVIPLEEYKGNTTNMLFKCTCGRKWVTIPARVLKGCHCRKCADENMRGENNPSWNPNLSQEDRELGNHRFLNPKYKKFIHDCFERDNYTCQITDNPSNGNISVHHINGYNWDIDNRTNIDNGITLSDEIHKEFHKKYGKGNNTKAQFIEFVEMLYKDKRISTEKYNSLLVRLSKIK